MNMLQVKLFTKIVPCQLKRIESAEMQESKVFSLQTQIINSQFTYKIRTKTKTSEARATLGLQTSPRSLDKKQGQYLGDLLILLLKRAALLPSTQDAFQFSRSNLKNQLKA